MIGHLKIPFLKLLAQGQNPLLFKFENERVRLTNIYSLVLSMSCIFIGTLFFLFQKQQAGFLLFTVSLVFCLCILVNSLRQYYFSRVLLFLNGYVTIYIFSAALGPECNTQFWFLTGIALSLVLFDMTKSRYLVTSVATACGCLVFLWVTDFKYSPIEKLSLDAFASQLVMISNVTLSFSIGLSGLIFLFFQLDRSSQEIQHYLTAQIENSQIKFRSIFDQGAAGIVFADLNGTITECNERYASFHGLKKSELIGRNVADLIMAEDRHLHSDEIKKLLAGQINMLAFERKFMRPDGTLGWCLVNASRITDQTGNVVYLAAYLQDITQLKILQQNLTYTVSLAAVGEMSAGVAHEINNPLAIIQGKASFILERLKQDAIPIEKQKLELEKIISTTTRIAKIVQGLLSFTRVNTDEPLDSIDALTLIENVRSVCEQRFRNSGIQFLIDPIPAETLSCRAHQIEQVLLNLLNNAFDAVATLEQKWIKLSVSIQSQTLLIKVTDSGLGVPEKLREKIMQPFFTTKGVGKGTGLGLSISKGLIESHGGSLQIDTNEANTCFVIQIPLHPQVSKLAS